MPSSSDSNFIEYLKSLYANFSTNSSTDKAIAVVIPLTFIITIVFLILIIGLLRRKKELKAKLNKTPEGSPPSSDSDMISISKADIIPRPSSVV